MTDDRLREYLKRVTIDLTEARRRLAELEGDRHEPIAVVGMACRYPGGVETPEGFWELLSEGRDAVGEVPASRWDIDDYYTEDRREVGGVYTRQGAFLADVAGWDAGFFGVPPREALRMDPQQRLLMELVWEGLENAGTTPARLAGSRTAVMVGLMDTVQYGRLEMERTGAGVVADPYFGQGVSTSVAAGRLAYQYDLRGPTLTLDTACSSSLVGVHLAAEALRRGECDLAIAAGAHLNIRPDTYVQGCATGMLAPDGRCKTFDAAADGYVMGEGGGLVVLERLSCALANGRRIRAVIRGSAVNQDGRSNGLTAPNRGAQVDVIRRALAAAHAAPADVDYVEAHGSGTHLGDAIEISALHDVFGATGGSPLLVGAVKTNIGHTQAAAGIAGLIKTVLVLENGAVPANRNLETPSAAVPADGSVRPVTHPAPLPGGRRVAGVSSFGWSGTNAHVVVETAPAVVAPDPAEAAVVTGATGPAVHTLPLSAATPAALTARMTDLAAWLADRPGADLGDVAHTLQHGRAELDHRRALVCTGPDDAVAQLRSATTGSGSGTHGRPRVAFLLPGTGDQYAGLGRELYAGEPVYAAAVDECIALVQERCGTDLRPHFFPATDTDTDSDSDSDSDSGIEIGRQRGDLAAMLGRAGADAPADPLEQAEVAHPFLFTVQYALARLLAHQGVKPDVLVGYSLGEYVAACLAGTLTLSDALYVVVERARLIATAQPGQMVAVAAGEQQVREIVAAADADVDVAALNGPTMTVLSGPESQIRAITTALTAAGIAARPLRTAHAFHSGLLTPVQGKLAAALASVTLSPPSTTIVSNTTGRSLTADQATSSEYWAEHLVSPIRFADGIRHCLAQEVDVFVELGAGQTLGGLVRQNLPAGSGVDVLGTLPAAWTGAGAVEGLAATRARLWERGAPIAWPETGRVVTLPTYPFQRTAFWPEQNPAIAVDVAPRSRPAELCYAPSWTQDVRRHPAPVDRPDAVVVLADPGGAGTRLADLLEAAGTPVLEVVPGHDQRREGRRLVIDPADPAHYRAAAAAAADLPGAGPVHVVHAWSLLADPAVADHDERLEQSIGHGFDSLLLTVQAFGDLSEHRPVRLLTVSRGASEILGDDATAPHQAGVHGLGRVVQHEYRGLGWRGVDLDPVADGTDPGPAAEALRRELLTGGGPEMSGWRRGRRWTRDWAEVPLPEAPPISRTAAPWRPDGVYLITGGTRGLGLALAEHLVRAGVRKLALVGRSAGAGPRPEVADLEAAGAEVLLLTADVGVPAQLRAALRACREHFGALTGVVHAAGVPAGGMVRRRTPAETRSVLAPKVLAMGPLAELFGPGTPEAERPELLVLYSSAVTAFGGIGEGDYCAANTVLDAYGAALAAAAPEATVVSVAWGPWLHDAWQSGAGESGLAERARAYREEYGFTTDAGCALLDRIVTAGHGSVVAVRQPLEESVRDWAAMVDLDSLVDASTVAPPTERFPRPQLRTEYAAPRTGRETAIAEVWQAYLGIDRVGIHDPFFDLGGNSLVGMAMVLAVEKELGRPIAPAVLFEHPTVAAFAAALDTADGRNDSAQERLDTSSARGQRRRRARSGRGNEG